MSSITIRPIQPDDYAQWAELWRGYLTFYETTLPDEVYQSSFDRMLGDDPRDFSGMLALDGDRPVGLVHYLFHRHGWKVEEVCYLQDLFTLPDMRGRGVGRALIEAVYDAADAYGAPSVYWLTQDFNASARILYDQVGTLTPFIKYQRT
ncbi:GNAT family N-acetyltransferase [Rhodovulum sp. FJ3]|uniref:GNAT family N-acetyltransferase n=1 Tax=Rhodovulum sp. FJ3 TaxID=3079053 RepID=UPI00293DE2BC|nr:GNAT family N-acetyltransferase [Rhodovulum sp. FJ3]MDV4167640.1 GNAT family N-acetyltransferase [Rhodovulum sp. FJ3]